ncbi:MAG: helix-turn-helix transcriptional regulator [Ktedonobacteraceae bacterium]|nr:helix-turn-helix transcriptional regulator [Ktedonobacteraceae bacterium]
MQTCIQRSASLGRNTPPGFILPEAPRLSAARFDGPCVSRHVHQYFEIVYIEAGEGMHGIEDHSVPTSEGDVFLIAPGEMHDTSCLKGACKWVVAFGADALNPSHTDAITFVMPTDELLLLAFFRPLGIETEHFCVPVIDRPRWIERFHLLERELHAQRLGYEDAARSLLVLLLTDVARLAFNQEHSPILPSRLLLTQIFRYIDAHFRDPISLREVATNVGHASAYLTDLVRRETGRTVLEWIVERRMTEARYLLRETNQTIQQIAEVVGYGHTGHFIKQFKRLHGMTPSAWRSPQPKEQERKILL